MKRWCGGAAVVCALTMGSVASVSVQEKPATAAQGKPAGAAQGKATGTAQNRGADSTFMKTAAMDGMAEVEHGRLAADHAASSEVKQFGQRMVDDHSKANSELQSLASQKNVTLPAKLDAKHQAMQDRLAKLKGAAFDTAYMSHMATAHRQAVTLFQREAKSGHDAETKAFAEKTLPTLQEHMKMAQELSAKSGKSGKTPK